MRTLEQRFWSKVDKAGPDECWVWAGGRNQSGHGRFMLEDRRVGYAHRASYELHIGPIPDGLHVCHHCDNPPCVNPAHLFVGTVADNMADRGAKGRTRTGVTLGERHHASKLRAADVPTIRARLAAGDRQTHIAADYGVSQTAIWAIREGHTWRHVA